MTPPDLPWEAWRSFLAALRRGSLSGAARELGLTQPTLGRHIDVLESGIGARLFLRGRDGLHPTPLALGLRARAEALEAAAGALLREASTAGDEAKGTVRITAPEMLGIFALPALLVPFRHDNPAIDLELSLSDTTENLLSGEVDLAIRLYRPRQEALLTHKIGDLRLGLFGARGYLSAAGRPESFAAAKLHPMIGYDRAQPALPEDLDPEALPEHYAFRCDNAAAQWSAIREGLGLGILPLPLGLSDPELDHILPTEVALSYPVWIAIHEGSTDTPAIRKITDHLGPALSDWLKTY